MRIVFVICFLAISCVSFSGGDLPLYVLKMIGTLNQEEGKSIALSSDGRIYALSATNALQTTNSDILLTCMDEDLNCLWSKTYGQLGIEQAHCIEINSDDRIFISGTELNTSSQGYDFFIMEVSLDGELLSYQSFVAPSWQIMHSMVLFEERPLVLIEDYSVSQRYRMLKQEEDLSYTEYLLPEGFSNKVITSFNIHDAVVYMSTNNLQNFDDGTNPAVLYAYRLELETFNEINLVSSQGNVRIKDVYVDSNAIVHVAGEVDTNEFTNGYYGRFTAVGDFVYESVLGGVGDYGFTKLFVTDSQVITPGYTYAAGAGEMDVFVLFQSLDGMFLGAPTAGGESMDVLSDAFRKSNGEIFCLGTSYSFNGQNGETMFFYLSNTLQGDYDQQFDMNNDCFIVGIEGEITSSDFIVDYKYFDLLGREIFDINQVKGIFIQVAYYKSGQVEVTKLYR